MKTGKAAGSDFIETEHLRNAHSIIVSWLSVLFNAILKYGYVPVLLYGSECIDCNISYISCISKSWNSVFGSCLMLIQVM